MKSCFIATILLAISFNSLADVNNPQSPSIQALDAQHSALCEMQEFETLFRRTPCNGGAITFEQLVDNTKITKEQKPILLKFRMQVDSIEKAKQEWRRKNGNKVDRLYADFYDTQGSVIDQYYLDLYNEKITWAEFNKSRKGEVEKINAEVARIINAVKQSQYTTQPITPQPTDNYQQQKYASPQMQPIPQNQPARMPTVTTYQLPMPQQITPYELPMPQQPTTVQQQQPVSSHPTTTNCYEVGNRMNCTTQ